MSIQIIVKYDIKIMMIIAHVWFKPASKVKKNFYILSPIFMRNYLQLLYLKKLK